MKTLNEFLDTLVDKINEYEERRVTRDVQLESSLNDWDQLSANHKLETAELLEKIQNMNVQFENRTKEVEECQRSNNYLQLQLNEVNDELQVLIAKVETQNEFKVQVDFLLEEKEDLIKT